ncbi:tyrosine-type recombinase/integrase [Sediminibacterium ginsengisoli]|uniref:Site-specific recombinase XerD n=1 Tax=Sediminibacterium ginsengisoli TaxID=413434 RepID=A0A1T4P2Z3_9BACT|nr:site-specific integrase [Sediminibacterium ginsengisoli]SJZ85771.1 Site-specific recombinase XerD [Sediminibacterium ginsengisoli]
MSVTYVIRLDERKIKLDQTYPVKLWVTFQRRALSYTTKISLSKADYSKLSASNLRNELKEVRDKIHKLEMDLDEYIRELGEFSFEIFEMNFVSRNSLLIYRSAKKSTPAQLPQHFDFQPFEKKFRILKEDGAKKDNLLGGYVTYVSELLQAQSPKTADLYQTAYYSLFSFKGNLRLASITKQYLKEYDAWMRNKQLSRTTIGMYLRTLRKIFNNAIDNGIFSKKDYPFGRNKYIIPSGRNVKKALDKSLLAGIYYYNPVSEREWFARDTWLFLYFGNGMNPKDMALLKYKNIDDGFLVFDRSKIETTAKEQSKPVSVFITEEISNIINRWGNRKISNETYIFPVLKDGMNSLEQMTAIQYFVKATNYWMKDIFSNLGYNKKSTTVVARHSFSTHMLHNGASKELIQESLGHLNIKTTENYLGSFEKPVVREFAEKMMSFKRDHNSE